MSVVRRIDPEPLEEVYERSRAQLERALARGAVVTPVEALAIVYRLRAPAQLRRQVRGVLRTREPESPCGGVYVLRDPRDPVAQLKIGMTRRPFKCRLAEHRHDLGCAEAIYLVTVRSRWPRTLELLVHELLAHVHLDALVNTRTRRPVTEYYALDDVARLERLLRALARYLDAEQQRWTR